MENNIKCDSKIKANLSIFRIVIISILAILVVLVAMIGYIRKEEQGTINEIVLDWETPHITYSGEEIICGILAMIIVVIVVLRPDIKVVADVIISKDKIEIKYIDKNGKIKSSYLIDVSKIKSITYEFDKEDNEKILKFNGKENMVKKCNSKNGYDKFEFVFKQESDDICNCINNIIDIKGF